MKNIFNEKKFKKYIHPDIDSLDVIIDFKQKTINFLFDFEDFFSFEGNMFDIFLWYYENPADNYNYIINKSEMEYQVLVLIDKRTGHRSLKNWDKNKNAIIYKFVSLRKEHCKY